MDLSFIQEALDSFATFAGNIQEFLTAPVAFFQEIANADFDSLSSNTSSAIQGDYTETDNGAAFPGDDGYEGDTEVEPETGAEEGSANLSGDDAGEDTDADTGTGSSN